MIRTENYLKSRFLNGMIPTQEDYEDLIDTLATGIVALDSIIAGSPQAGHVPTSAAVKLLVEQAAGQRVLSAQTNVYAVYETEGDAEEYMALIGEKHTAGSTGMLGAQVIITKATAGHVGVYTFDGESAPDGWARAYMEINVAPIDALNSTDTTRPLSANMGRVLDGAIGDLKGRIEAVEALGLSVVNGKVCQTF